MVSTLIKGTQHYDATLAGGTPFLQAEWRYIAMLNYCIHPVLLQPFVPQGTSLDLFQGQSYVSLVAFLFLNTRVMGVPVPFHVNFEEINLRFYVKRYENDELRRGAVFIKELVPKRAVAYIARKFYNEPYSFAKMRHCLTRSSAPFDLRFDWTFAHAHQWLSLSAEEGDPKALVPGSEPQFIADHYWGYTRQRNGGTMEYQVCHPQWRIWDVKRWSVHANWRALYGEQFVDVLDREPSSVFIAEGSPIALSKGKLVPQSSF